MVRKPTGIVAIYNISCKLQRNIAQWTGPVCCKLFKPMSLNTERFFFSWKVTGCLPDLLQVAMRYSKWLKASRLRVPPIVFFNSEEA